MPDAVPDFVLAELRSRIARLEQGRAQDRAALPFGVKSIDAVLPGGGLAFGALHEVAGGGDGAVDGAAAALFAAGVASRTKGKVLWCVTRPDLFAPALSQAGLAPARVIYVEAGDEKSMLSCFEEGLRHGGFGAVVAEVARLSMTTSRRLQLAAEGSGTIGIAVRRWRRPAEVVDFDLPTAAATRWRVCALPSEPLPAGDRAGPLAAGADALPRRRERALRRGGLRCEGSSRSTCRAGRRIGCGGRRASPRRLLTFRSRSSAGSGGGASWPQPTPWRFAWAYGSACLRPRRGG